MCVSCPGVRWTWPVAVRSMRLVNVTPRGNTVKTTAKELLNPYENWVATQTGEYKIFGTTGYLALLKSEAKHVANVRNSMRTPYGGWKNQFPLEHATLLGFCLRQLRTGGKIIDAPGMREALNSADDDLYKTAHGLMAAGMYVDDINWRNMTSDQIVDHCWLNSN